MRNIFTSVIIFLCTTGMAFGATKIIDEDFEGVTGFSGGMVYFNVSSHGDGEATALSGMDAGLGYARPFHCGCDGTEGGCYDYPSLDAEADQGGIVETGGNPGAYVRAKTGGNAPDGQSYSEPKWMADSVWSAGERTIYFKFDVKIFGNMEDPHDTGDFEGEDFKFFRITSHTTADAVSTSHWHPQYQMVPGTTDLLRWGYYGGDTYYFRYATTKIANSLDDNDWHTYEVFIDIGTHRSSSCGETPPEDPDNDGIVRVWEDGVLILEDTKVPMGCDGGEYSAEDDEVRSLAVIRHFKYPVDGGNIGFDNIEVWDGMPDTSTTTITGIPTIQGVTIR